MSFERREASFTKLHETFRHIPFVFFLENAGTSLKRPLWKVTSAGVILRTYLTFQLSGDLGLQYMYKGKK